MIPLSDNNPTRTIPIVTYALIAACVLMFLYQWGTGSQEGFETFTNTYGFIPASFFGHTGASLNTAYGASGAEPSPWLTMFTAMFMHGSLAHIGGNLLYLWIFGDNIENELGKVKYLLFYLACGVAAALSQAFVDPTSTVPMVGASGAISGVLGGYILLHPKQNIVVMMPNVGIRQVPAFIVLGLWFGYQLMLGVMSDPAEGGVAFFAHIGGFIAGFVLILPLVLLRKGQKPQLWR